MVRFGLVGTAFWAAEVHAQGLLATPGVELVGVHGRSHEKAVALAAKLGVRAFERYEEMLDHTDAISIAVSPEAQPDYALKAAAAAKHLLLEKPVSTSLAATRALADTVRETNVAALVFFTRRFVPQVASSIEREAGHWTRAMIRIHASPMSTDSPYKNSVWRADDGAALWDIGPHVLSILLPMLGPIVTARAIRSQPRFTRFETRHEHGAEAEISLTLHAAPDERLLEYRFSNRSGELVLPEPDFSKTEIFSNAATDLLSMISTGRRDHPCDMRLGLETVRILDQIERDAPTT